MGATLRKPLHPSPPMTGGDSSATLAPPPKGTTTTTTTTTLSLGADLPPAAVTHGRRLKARRASPIHKLADDLLLEIFLRLPSLATLVRAAFTCRAWRRAVASSPEFRRRFRAIHPVPLLGIFFDATGASLHSYTPAFPTFIPYRGGDTDLRAAVRGGDFLLTSIQGLPDQALSWQMVDCCRGCVLLMNWDVSSLVVFNPLTPQCQHVFDMGCDDMFDGTDNRYHASPRLLISAEDPKSFRVVILVYDKCRVQKRVKCRVRAVFFSSDSWKWSVQPWVEVPPSLSSVDDEWIEAMHGLQANGHLYWVYKDQRYLISLDTATMEFCVAVLPHYLKHRDFDVGETKDGKPCIVFSDNLNVGVLMLDNDGVERWVLDKLVPMGRELERALRVGLDDGSDPSGLSVFAVRDGYVYLTTMTDDFQTPCWLLSLCLETMSFERLFKNMFDDAAHPYIMEWPTSLLGNYGSFAVEDASSPLT